MALRRVCTTCRGICQPRYATISTSATVHAESSREQFRSGERDNDRPKSRGWKSTPAAGFEPQGQWPPRLRNLRNKDESHRDGPRRSENQSWSPRRPDSQAFGMKNPNKPPNFRPRHPQQQYGDRNQDQNRPPNPNHRFRQPDAQSKPAFSPPGSGGSRGEAFEADEPSSEGGRDGRPFKEFRGRAGRDRGESRSFKALLSDEQVVLNRGPKSKGKEKERERGSARDDMGEYLFQPKRDKRKTSNQSAQKKRDEEKEVFIPSTVTVGRLADIFGVKIFNLATRMMRLGMSEDQRRPDYLLTPEEACNIALEYGFNPIVDDERSFDILPQPDTPGEKPLRPPVVTIMGHVDHGKTTLLDSLRHTSVASGEAGGITQHIGAFSVPLPSLIPSAKDGTITFLDTPGHAAFTAMRARGASVTDIVVLVVAADDGVMPQTKEVLELVKSEGDKVGLVVAINKCDKPGIDFSKVKSALGGEGILLEEDGGEIPAVRVSGLAKIGLDDLVETLATLAEIRDLRARQDGAAEGYVLESRVDRGRGNVATVLVSKGTLRSGSYIVAGTTWARVRQMQDDLGKPISSAGPGTPVSITGWKDLPSAGDQLLEAADENLAKRAITNRLRTIERQKLQEDVEQINTKRAEERRRTEEEEAELEKIKEEGGDVHAWMMQKEHKVEESGFKELRLVIKGDVSGTVEAVVGSLEHIGNKEAGVKIIHTGVGEVSESDIHLAEASEAHVIGFSVACPRSIQTLANQSNVPLHLESVIYRLIDTVRSKVAGLLPPSSESKVAGEATCHQVFEIKLKGKNTMKVAGCRVGNGTIGKNVGVRVLRGPERTQVYEGTIETLKHLKKDVDEVRKGTECGISFHDWSDLQEGDEIVSFTTFEVAREL